jgi:hypothetical protein
MQAVVCNEPTHGDKGNAKRPVFIDFSHFFFPVSPHFVSIFALSRSLFHLKLPVLFYPLPEFLAILDLSFSIAF